MLVVEDNDALRRVTVQQLQGLGYRTFAAADGLQALALLRGNAAIDLLFTDIVMPGMDGRALAEQARRLRPGLKILFTSGFMPGATDGNQDPIAPLLTKPCSKEELARAVRAVLDAEQEPGEPAWSKAAMRQGRHGGMADSIRVAGA